MAIDLTALVPSRWLEERLDAAISKAKKAAHGVVETEEDLDMHLRIKLSQHYGIPIFDTYLDRTVDDLAFEAFLISELSGKVTETPDKTIKANS